jgi:hypothetical protein
VFGISRFAEPSRTQLLCCLQVPNLVGVPTHFFKVVLAESKSRNLLGAKPVGATGLHDRAARPQSCCACPQSGCPKHAQWTDVSCGVITQTVVGAFVMPNAPIDPDMPLTSFTVPLEALESASGLRFFPVRTVQHLHAQQMHPMLQVCLHDMRVPNFLLVILVMFMLCPCVSTGLLDASQEAGAGLFGARLAAGGAAHRSTCTGKCTGCIPAAQM